MKYIAFCDIEKYKYENRSVAPSASNVVKYMADVFSEKDEVVIVSPSRTLNRKGLYKGRISTLSNKVAIIQPPSFGASNPISKIFAVLYTKLWLFFYLLKHLDRHEKIVVYHSLSYMKTIAFFKKLKKLSITLEIREIYSDINKVSSRGKKQEQEFFKIADKYIFATGILDEIINTEKKPSLIASGIYKPEKSFGKKFDDNKVHVVYAGTLRPEKGGAVATVKMARYLSENYHVHILGYGTQDNIDMIKSLIEETQTEDGTSISYDGVLSGDEFSSFLQSCNIGVAIQNMEGAFNNTSFPSKVLTYLSNGLDVLSTDIPAVSKSGVGEILYYCSNNDPKEMAAKLLEIDISNPMSKNQTLINLDYDLRKDIVDFL